MQTLKRFGDFAEEESPLDGAKIKIGELLNQEILILAFKVRHSKFEQKGSGKCLTLQFEKDGVKGILFTGSSVLLDQIQKYQGHLPFLTTIKKIDRFYTFV